MSTTRATTSRAGALLAGAVFALPLAGGLGCGSASGDGTALADWTYISQAIVEDGEPRALVEGTAIRLRFDGDELVASAGCNTFRGEHLLEGGHLEVTALGGTEMGCDLARHAQDEWLTDLLASSPRWSLDGDTLTLTGDEAEVVLVDREVVEPDAGLEGTRWVLDTVVDGEVASSVPPDAAAHLVIEAGEVSGRSGCNQFGGAASVEGDVIRFVDVTSTLMGCDEPAASIEATFLTVLEGPATFEVDADRLTLSGPDGAGLGFVAR